MKTLNEILENYGLQAKNNPKNSELKRLLRYVITELRNPLEEVIIEYAEPKVPRILMGDSLINRCAYRVFSREVGPLLVSDVNKFNQRFTLSDKKPMPKFLLENVQLKFEDRLFESFVYFKRKEDLYFYTTVSEALVDEAHPIHLQFVEEKLKNVFSPERPSKKSEKQNLEETLNKMVVEVVSKLERKAVLSEMKKEIIEFMFQLIQEIVIEEKNRN